MPGVFIGYRRDDEGMLADEIASTLEESFDGPVFFDRESIQAGRQFETLIEAALTSATVVLVILGTNWYGAKSGGLRRIDDESDWFHREIKIALASRARVIPVLVGNIPKIAPEEIPESLRGLTGLQWHRIQLDDKRRTLPELVELVERAVQNQKRSELFAKAKGLERYQQVVQLDAAKDTFRASALAPVFNEEMTLRVHVALATGRPLLAVGSRGTGRVGLASFFSHALGWRLYEQDLSSDSGWNGRS